MKVLSFGDVHFPFTNKRKLNKVIDKIKAEKPDVVIQLGDIYDQYMFSRFGKDYNVISPKQELDRAKKDALNMWKKIKKAAPRARLMQLMGNHDIRMMKKALNKFPEAMHIFEDVHKKLYQFDGVETMESDRDYIEIDGVVYCHGWASSHINHFRQPVVRAHDHRAWVRLVGDNTTAFGGIVYKDPCQIFRSKDTVFEASAGMFADEKAVPLGYTSSRRTDWRAAVVIVTEEHLKLEIL